MNRKLAAAVPILVVLLVCGCSSLYQSVSQNTASDGERNLELSANPDSIDIAGGGSITILVHASYAGGSAIANGTITLTSTLGTLAAAELTTDEDGIASTTLTPGTETGWAVVVATLKTIQTSVTISFYQTPGSD